MKEWRHKPRKLGKPLLRIYQQLQGGSRRAGFSICVKDLCVIGGSVRLGYLPQIVALALSLRPPSTKGPA